MADEPSRVWSQRGNLLVCALIVMAHDHGGGWRWSHWGHGGASSALAWVHGWLDIMSHAIIDASRRPHSWSNQICVRLHITGHLCHCQLAAAVVCRSR